MQDNEYDSMTNNYVNISKSILFSNMKIIPKTVNQMCSFMYCHKGIEFLNYDKIMTVCKFYEIDDSQLETLFVLARVATDYYDMIEEKMCEFIHDNMLDFPNPIPEFLKLCSEKKFIKSYFKEIFTEITYKDEDRIENVSNEILTEIFISMLKFKAEGSVYLNPYPNSHANINYKLKIFQYLTENMKLFETFVNEFRLKLLSMAQKFINIGNKILDLCSTSQYDTNDHEYLENFCNTHIKSIPQYDDDIFLKKFYHLVTSTGNDSIDSSGDAIHSSDDTCDVISWDEIPLPCNKIYGCQNSNNANNTNNANNANNANNFYFCDKYSFLERANSELLKIGYKVAGDNYYLYPIDCFVQHGLANNRREIISLILFNMSHERDTTGFINKYDAITLVDYFTMICIANDIQTSYDTFLIDLQNESVSIHFPPEILFRIISRIYNVIVIFYTGTLTKIVIDNALEDNTRIIEIHQSHNEFFYNIIPFNTEFVPINETEYIDTTGIVEI